MGYEIKKIRNPKQIPMTQIRNKVEKPKTLLVLKIGKFDHSDLLRPTWTLLQVICCFLLFSGFSGAEDATEQNWQVIETKHATIRFLSTSDFRLFNAKLKYSAGQGGFFGFLSSSKVGKGLTDTTAEKVDAIYQRVQEILDMKKRMKKVLINVYHDSKQLGAAFTRIYQRPCRIRAWYRYRNHTIYVNARDLHAGMLAHEIAHSIIDNCMTVRPPRATAEILARYVDQHLEE